ncbi:MAG: suppressor of fused domain protein [Putridiphycobacter sp.]|nr:suppressor of fused domain protein [Putridiphycobacter sp.]
MAEKELLATAFKHEKTAEFSSVSVYCYQPFSHSSTMIYTQGLANNNQHALAGKTDQIYPYIEVYFLVPSYWNVAKADQKWPLEVINRIVSGRVNQKAWYGPGDTFTAHPKAMQSDEVIDTNSSGEISTIPKAINKVFKQNHFILTEPVAAQGHLTALEGDSVNYLAIVPIYQKEFEYKTSRSALELIMKFEQRQINELIDEHRPIAARKKFFGLF